MKNKLLILLVLPLLISCKSKEEKAQALINDDMFKSLYDYDSYQPIESILDSAFTDFRDDTLFLKYAAAIQVSRAYQDELVEKMNKYVKLAERFEYDYKLNDAYITVATEAMLGAYNLTDFIERYQDSIKIAHDNFKQEFIGWKVRHKYRVKSNDGIASLSTHLYIFDKDLTKITCNYNPEEKLIIELNKITEDALSKKD